MTTRSKAEIGAILDAYMAAQRKHQNRQDLEFETLELRHWLIWCLYSEPDDFTPFLDELLRLTEELK